MFSGATKEFKTIGSLAAVGAIAGVGTALYKKKCATCTLGFAVFGALIGGSIAIAGYALSSFKK